MGFHLAEDREVCFQFAGGRSSSPWRNVGSNTAGKSAHTGQCIPHTTLNTCLPKTIILPANIACLWNWLEADATEKTLLFWCAKNMVHACEHQGKGIWVIKYISIILYICLRFFFSCHWNFCHHFVVKAVLVSCTCFESCEHT